MSMPTGREKPTSLEVSEEEHRRYEEGDFEMVEVIRYFSRLIASGELEGLTREHKIAGRSLMKNGIISEDGEIDWDHYRDLKGHDWQKGVLDLHGRRVAFYPACAFDWLPIARLSHLIDTFVLCDVNARERDYVQSIRSLRPHHHDVPGFVCVGNRKIDMDRAAAGIQHELAELASGALLTVRERWAYSRMVQRLSARRSPGWGYQAHLGIGVGQERRIVELLYFNAEAVAAYLALFVRQRIRPRALCLKLPGGGWTDLYGWPDGPFARALARNEAGLPDLLVTNERSRVEGRWPYPHLWQRLGPAGTLGPTHALAARPTVVPDGSTYPLAPEAGGRAVTVRYGPLTAEAAEDAEAVVLSGSYLQMSKQGRDALLAGRRAIASSHLCERDTRVPADAIAADICGQRIGTALQRLSEVCEREGIESVVAPALGRENEGAELARWATEPGWPKRLTVCVVTPGDLHSYVPNAVTPPWDVREEGGGDHA